jgi:hypothetical protein
MVPAVPRPLHEEKNDDTQNFSVALQAMIAQK